MPTTEEARARLAAIPGLTVTTGTPLSGYTRFGIGGPADVFAETGSVEAFAAAVAAARASGIPTVVIGGGTNLIVSDRGFRGIVLRYRADRLAAEGRLVRAEAGAVLQDLVDFTIERGLAGPGDAGGHTGLGGRGHLRQRRRLRTFHLRAGGAACGSSMGMRSAPWGTANASSAIARASSNAARSGSSSRPNWRWKQATPPVCASAAGEILRVRNEKFPVTMKCAGSIFKNLLFAELPAAAAAAGAASAVREGKVAAAWFLEQAGAKGMRRGDIHVADYHANLIYNGGAGTAADLGALIGELKARVRARFGLELEEEVQYVG